jgi:hypothetical protein
LNQNRNWFVLPLSISSSAPSLSWSIDVAVWTKGRQFVAELFRFQLSRHFVHLSAVDRTVVDVIGRTSAEPNRSSTNCSFSLSLASYLPQTKLLEGANFIQLAS